MDKKLLIVVFTIFLIWFIVEGADKQYQKKKYKLNRSDSTGTINVYFNSGVDLSFASSKKNYANGNVNLENIVLKRIKESKTSISVAVYELNLPKITNALIKKSAEGVSVRIIVDSKNPKDEHYIYRYKIFRLNIEKLIRGKDGKIGTFDDVKVFSDGPIFIVEDENLRKLFFKKKESYMDIPYKEIKLGKKTILKRIISLGEYNTKKNKFYLGREQMHNKYLVFDNKIVWTGSWNLTVTGLYGSEKNMKLGKLNGNIQHSIEIIDKNVAKEFTNNFNTMWGSSTKEPNIYKSKYHSRKHYKPSTYIVGGNLVELFFPAGKEFLDRVNQIIINDYDNSLYFTIFAWSYQPILNSIKLKSDKKNGLKLKGVFDDSFWNQWWSASYDMRGKIGKSSKNNPSVPWDTIPDIYPDGTPAKMHAKTMIIDGNSNSDPTVITGSANWSINSIKKNDENVLIIHSKMIANQFLQSFFYSYNIAKRLK